MYRNKRAMLPEIKSIYKNLKVGEQTLLIFTMIFWPIGVVSYIVYYIANKTVVIPKKIISCIVGLIDARNAKMRQGRISLLCVGQTIKLVRWDEINDNEDFTIQAINEDTISGKSTTVIAGTFLKKNIVLIDGELYILERPYAY
jgi:hypothetical protein